MLFADCPFCDTPALVDEASGALACEPCSLTLPIDDEAFHEPFLPELAAAA
jgi:uncharacterized protein YbaR (Trm112 family)